MKLKHVKINPSDLCNLRCQFCPRGNPDIYPNQNEHMTMETFHKVLDHLADIEGQFYFEMVGHGEPTIARHFQEMSQVLYDAKLKYPNMVTRVVSNGYRFDKYIDEIKMYDQVIYDVYTDDEDYYWEQIVKYKDLNFLACNMMNSVGKLRFTYDGKVMKETEMLLNNRGNKFTIPLIGDLNPPKHGTCIRPVEDITVNWNGDYILCCEDWDNIKLGNVHEETFKEFYYENENFVKYRDQLNQGIRAGQCEGCSYPGHNNWRGDKPWMGELDDEWKANIEERLIKIHQLPDMAS